MSASGKKDLISSVQFYVDKIVADPTIGGMKALLLDSQTTKIVSMVYSQTQILEKEVYLVEKLGKRHESMNHLKAAVFIAPTEANFELLTKELKDPKFKEYHIFFSYIVPADMLSRLGRLDEHEYIMQVQEYYANYMAINDDFFHLGLENSISLSSPSRAGQALGLFEQNVNGLLSVLLSMKRRPSQIRYQTTSDLARRMANEVLSSIDREDGLFDFRRQEGPLLVILDRADDPITPLLTQWTYQAMVHELLGLNNNRVIMRGAPNINKDLEEVVLSAAQDDFFAKNRYANFGDIAGAVKSLLDEYQKHTKQNENIKSIEDMQAFLERFPDFRARSINVSKHVAVISELSRLTDSCLLLDISQLEQEIACGNDHSLHKQELIDRIRNPRVKLADKVRLSLLFIIRYESYNEARELKSMLSGASAQQLAMFDSLLEYAGDARRAPGLFSHGGLMNKLKNIASNTVNGIENVYTQHLPVLHYVLESIMKGKMKDANFPPLIPSGTQSGKGSATPSDILIFMVGGATFEEAAKVAEFNAANPNTRVILGGSSVQNSTSFLREISSAFAH